MKKDAIKKTSKREAIASQITDLAMKKAPKKQLEKAIKKSTKVLDEEKKAKAKKPVKKVTAPTKKPISKAVRDKHVYVRLNETEYNTIKNAAKKAKVPVSTWIRDELLYRVTKDKSMK